MRYVDLHCHLIPEIDDGATSLLETIEMLRYAHDHGTRGIVASPHTFHSFYKNDHPLAVHDAYAHMVKRLHRLGQNYDYGFLKEMAIYLGSENFVSPEFLAALKRRDVLTLNGSRYLLIEFPPYLPFETVESALAEIFYLDLVPVIAHVERYGFFERNLSRIASLKQIGCVIQVNAEAIVDLKGRGVARVMRPVLEAGLVDIVASDGHDVHSRPPDLAEAHEVLSAEFSDVTVAAWLWDNPARILHDREIITAG